MSSPQMVLSSASLYYSLAECYLVFGGDVKKAEMDARKCLRLRIQIYGSDGHNIGMGNLLLARILLAQNNIGDETRELFERALDIFIRCPCEGKYGLNILDANIGIGTLYYQLASIEITIELKLPKLQLARSYLEEALRARLKRDGPTHANTIKVKAILASVLNELQFDENKENNPILDITNKGNNPITDITSKENNPILDIKII